MNEDPKRNPAAALSEETAVENWLRARDPARGVPPGGFSPGRARAVVFTMRHPVVGWLWLHHRGVSRAAAVALVAAVLAVLFSIRGRERRALPPVALGVAPSSELPVVAPAAPDSADPDELPPPPAVSFPDGPPPSDMR